MFESLLKVQGSNDLTFTYKVTEFHLNVRGVQRQKVKTAAQLLSRTVAKAMQYFGDTGALTSNWKEVH